MIKTIIKLLLIGASGVLISCSKDNANSVVDNQALSVPDSVGEVTSYSFGSDIEQGSQIQQVFVFKKNSLSSEAAASDVVIQGSNKFMLVSAGGCHKPLIDNQACSVRIRMVTTDPGSYAATLNVGGRIINLSAVVIPAPFSTEIQVFSGGQQVSANSLFLESVRPGASHKRVFEVRNLGRTKTAALNVSATGDGFSLNSNGCGGAGLIPGKSCFFKVGFTNTFASPTTEDKTGQLTVGERSIDLQVRSLGTEAPELGSADFALMSDSSLINSVDFESVYQKDLPKTIVLTIANLGQNKGNPQVTSSSPNVEILSNSCSGTLVADAKCFIKVSLNPALKAPGSYSSTLNLNGAEIPVIGEVLEDTYNALDEVISMTPPSLNFGQVAGASSMKRIQIKNESNVAVKDLSLSLSNSLFSTRSNCPTVLGPKKTCMVEVTINTQGKYNIEYRSTLFVNNFSSNITAQVTGAQECVLANNVVFNFDCVPKMLSEELLFLNVSSSVGLSVVGGIPPYSFEVISGGGSINSSGQFSADAIVGMSTIRVSDNSDQEIYVSINKMAPFVVSPMSFDITALDEKPLVIQGGITPYDVSVSSGGGEIEDGPKFVAGSDHGVSTIRVVDAIGQEREITVNTVLPLVLTPVLYKSINEVVQLQPTLGLPPYTYALVSGGGVVNAAGAYTAPNVPGSSVVKVTDSLGKEKTVTINVYTSLATSADVIVPSGKRALVVSGGSGDYTLEFIQSANIGSEIIDGYYYAGYTESSVVEKIRVTDNLTGVVVTSGNITVTTIGVAKQEIEVQENAEAMAFQGTTAAVANADSVSVLDLSTMTVAQNISEENVSKMEIEGSVLALAKEGSVVLYEKSGANFVYQQTLSGSSSFGKDISLANSEGSLVLAVASNEGVTVYKKTTAWAQEAQVLAGAMTTSSVDKIDMSGKYLLVSSSVSSTQRKVSLIKRSAAGALTVAHNFDPIVTAVGPEGDLSVAVDASGMYAIGNALFSNTGKVDVGYISDLGASIKVGAVGTLTNPDPLPGEGFGASIKIKEDYVLVGSLNKAQGAALFSYTSQNFVHQKNIRADNISSEVKNFDLDTGKIVSLSKDDAKVYKYDYAMAKKWPLGTDLDLEITNGQVVELDAGAVKDYRNLTIHAGGILRIRPGNAWTIIGVSNSLILNGEIQGLQGPGLAGTITATTPDGEALSFTKTQANGGNGGASRLHGAAGGAQNSGNGGGGGGDTGTGSNASGSAAAGGGATATTSGAGGGSGAGAARALYGVNGVNATISSGGSGGSRGYHGQLIFIKVKGNIVGTGFIRAYGAAGGKGGNGAGYQQTGTASCNPTQTCSSWNNTGKFCPCCNAYVTTYSACQFGGGGGGGGAGGSGGSVIAKSRGIRDAITIQVQAGAGGGVGTAGNSATAGGAGGAGAAGQSSLVKY